MFIKTLGKRAAIAVSLGISLLGTSAAIPAASAATTTTYWTFQNSVAFNTCLESNGSGQVFVDACDNSSSQDWYWVGSADGWNQRQLKNRATGLCLVTDVKSGTSHANAVWASPCDNVASGQRWSFEWWPNSDYGRMYTAFSTLLRTSPSREYAVYTDSNADISWEYYDWRTFLH